MTRAREISDRAEWNQAISKGWYSYDNVGATSVLDSYNISSISDTGQGQHTANITNAFSTGNKASTVGVTNEVNVQHTNPYFDTTTTLTEGFQTYNSANSVNRSDKNRNNAIIFGTLA